MRSPRRPSLQLRIRENAAAGTRPADVGRGEANHPTVSPSGDRWPRLAWLAVLLLTGCAAPSPEPAPLPDLPARLAVESRVLRHVVHFATDSATPDAEERAALAAFLAALPQRTRVEIVAYGAADPRAGRTYNAELAARRARAVAEVVARSGLGVTVDLRSGGEAAAVGVDAATWPDHRRVEVVVRVDRVVAVPCEDAAGPVLGCALQRNLAAMIADPSELRRPREPSPPDSKVTAEAVGRLREDRVKMPGDAGGTP